jgi:Tfp pilus assembly protein PilN
MQAVNLLPEYARPGHRWTSVGSELNARKIIQIGGTAAIVAALLFGFLYFRERSVVSDKKSELTTAQAHLVAQQARAKPIQDAQAANTARLAFMRSVTSSRVHWDSVLGDLGRDLPAGVYLTTLSVAAPVPSPGAAAPTTSGATSFTIAGTTNSHNRVALVLDRLALLPWLSDITLQSSTRNGNTTSFNIGATYTGAGT